MDTARETERDIQPDDWDQQVYGDFLKDFEVTGGDNVTLDGIVGSQDAKNILTERVLSPIKLQQGKRKGGHILIYGVPGVGKTRLLQAVMNEALTSGALCVRLSVYDLLSRMVPSPTRLIDALFSRARSRSTSRSIVILEDIEVLSQGDNAVKHDLLTIFCSQLQKMKVHNLDYPVVIGVTNKPAVLTKDVIEQFDTRIYVPLPKCTEREDILKYHMKSVQHNLTDVHFRSLAGMMHGFTGADISVATRDASFQPVRKIQLATHFKKISVSTRNQSHTNFDELFTPCNPSDVDGMEMTWSDIPQAKLQLQPVDMNDVLKALSNMKPSMTSEEIQQFDSFHKHHGCVKSAAAECDIIIRV